MLKIELSGNCKVFRNEYPTKDGGSYVRYSTSLGKKLQDGNWDNAYINVQFKKGVELPNQMNDIEVYDGWLTFDKAEKNGKTQTYYKLFINDFKVIETGAPRPVRPSAQNEPDYDNAYASADDEDIPW